MVLGAGIDELVIVTAALSLPVWLAVEEFLHRNRPQGARHQAEESALHPGLTAADRLAPATVAAHR